MIDINNCQQQSSQLVPINPFKLSSAENTVCKVDIAGFLIDDYKIFNPEGHTILCNVGKACDSLSFFPETSTIIIDGNQQSQLLKSFEEIIPGIAQDLEISKQLAAEKSLDFFSNVDIRVQPVGIQGKVYHLLSELQNVVPVTYVYKGLVTLRTTGMTGLQIISKAPLTFVGVTYLGSMVFGYAGSIAGNNTLGSVLNVTSYICVLPMQAVEVTLNELLLRPISNAIGLPLILNNTRVITDGQGLSFEEYKTIAIAFEKICNSSVVKKATKIYKIIFKSE